MSERPAWRWLPVLAWGALFLFAALLALQQIRSFDYWWHLRTGQWIVENGRVPQLDPYTYTVEGQRWIDVHWLHQLGLYGVYRLGGHGGVVVAKAVLVLGLVALVAGIGARRERPETSLLALTLMLILACDRFMPRPELLTFLCLAGVLALLERHGRRPDRWVFGVVAIQLVWVNVHGLYALGLALCGIYLSAELLRPLVSPGESLRPAELRRLAAVTGLATAASLLNPNGLEGALYPLQQLDMIGPPEERGLFGSIISELIPPLAREGAGGALGLAALGAMAGLSFLAMLANWRRLPASHPLVWVAFLYLALGARRNVALFAIVAAPILVRNANEWLDVRAARRERGGPGHATWARRVAWAGLAALLGLLCLDVASDRFFPRLGSSRALGLGPMQEFHPVGAVDWIAEHRPPGPIFHHMADGGYLVWRLFPDYRVMVDGRLEIYGAERFVELQASDPTRFRALDAEFHFGAALVHYSLVSSGELLWWLYLNTNWRMVHVDEAAVLFVRLPRDGALQAAEIDPDAPDVFAPLDGEPGEADRIRRFARTHFFASLRRYERALAEWEATLERYPGLPQGRIIHAFLLERNGFGSAAETVLRELLRERPQDPALYAQVGDLRLAAGDQAAAREAYDAALGFDPNHGYAMYRRALLAEQDGDARVATALYLRIVARTPPANPLSLAARLRLRALQGG